MFVCKKYYALVNPTLHCCFYNNVFDSYCSLFLYSSMFSSFIKFQFCRHYFKTSHIKIYNSKNIMTLTEENNAAQKTEDNEVQVVNIETVEAKDNKGIDYDKLIGKI